MEKELKSCTGVLLRADLTGHSHPTLFGRNWLICWIGHALFRVSHSKGHPCRILIIFPQCSTKFYKYHISKNWRPILLCWYFWTFAQCVLISFSVSYQHSLWIYTARAALIGSAFVLLPINFLYCSSLLGLSHSIYIRGFTKFGIKVAWRLQFLEWLRTLSLKFQKVRTKIGVFLTLPS